MATLRAGKFNFPAQSFFETVACGITWVWLPLSLIHISAVHQEYVQQSIVVVVEESDSTGHRFDQVFLRSGRILQGEIQATRQFDIENGSCEVSGPQHRGQDTEYAQPCVQQRKDPSVEQHIASTGAPHPRAKASPNRTGTTCKRRPARNDPAPSITSDGILQRDRTWQWLTAAAESIPVPPVWAESESFAGAWDACIRSA